MESSWKAQINGNKTKALKIVGALANLAGSTWGARLIKDETDDAHDIPVPTSLWLLDMIHIARRKGSSEGRGQQSSKRSLQSTKSNHRSL